MPGIRNRYLLELFECNYYLIGWAPRYLVRDLMHAMTDSPGEPNARVLRFNEMPAPSKQRVLIELKGHLPENYSPMEDERFIALA